MTATLQQAVQRVADLTKVDLHYQDVFVLLSKATSELGELADAINAELDTCGHANKTPDEPSHYEAIDLVICGLALYVARHGDIDDIPDIMLLKLRKWERSQQEHADTIKRQQEQQS